MGTFITLFVTFCVYCFKCRTLTVRTSEGAEIIFTTIFIIMWAGSMIISINAKFLGAEM